MSRARLGEEVAAFVQAGTPARVTAHHPPDPNDVPAVPGRFSVEPPWVPFGLVLEFGNGKTVEIGFENGLWERDLTDIDIIREKMERCGWTNLVAGCKSGERIVFHDGGWVIDNYKGLGDQPRGNC